VPLLDVYFAAGSLTAEQKAELAERLTTSLLRAERAPDTPAFRTITWAYLHELDREHVLSAGRPASPPTFRIEATTPEGALSDRRRAEFVAAATQAVADVVGEVDGEPPPTWVLCREIAEGSWGAGGTVVAFKALQEAAAAERAAAQAAT
jgi:phenylpyruvate tautomerase PptA (4-oxalocrotonate tautomerase family)